MPFESTFRAEVARRELLRWLAGSPLLLPLTAGALLRAGAARALAAEGAEGTAGLDGVTRVAHFAQLARGTIDSEIYSFIAGGADDEKTVRANREAYDGFGIRARRAGGRLVGRHLGRDSG